MTQTRDFLQEAQTRGFVHQVTDAEAFSARLRAGTVAGYIGFDATADSLHVGSLVQIMLLRLMQTTGHKPVVLMGGGTTKVGDPSFRDEARPLLTDPQIELNKAGIRRVFDAFLRFGEGPSDAIMLDNAEWLDALRYVPFLRDIGRHFSVNRMLTMDSVKLRLERAQNLSFLEFNYMLLQAYDFLELARRFDCRIQMGGSDQWGNIVNGIDLTRRIIDKQVFGVTTPLITTASGGKMGKTAEGAVWLNPDMRSPYDYWQFWRNTEDADVGRFLRLFTDVSELEVRELEAAQGTALNLSKVRLANEATTLLHGQSEAKAAEAKAQLHFHSPTARIDKGEKEFDFFDGGKYKDLRTAGGLVALAGLAPSANVANGMIDQGQIKINDQVATRSTKYFVYDVGPDGTFKIERGKTVVRLRPK